MHEPSEGEYSYLTRINGLVRIFQKGSVNPNMLMDHLLLDTFYGSSAFGHILHRVEKDGLLTMPARSGFKIWPTEKFPDRFVTADTKLNRSLRTGQIVQCGSFDSFTFAGPDYLNDLFPNGFEASVAWPIPGVGSVLTFYYKYTAVDEGLRLFLETCGNIISMSLQESLASNDHDWKFRPDHPISLVTLTSRQWNILKAVRRGKTNPEIAADLDFSESLVRHETMKIYRKLRILGRKDLIDMPDEMFPFMVP